MNDTEQLLEDALHARTAGVTPLPGSRSAIAARLATDKRRQTWPLVAAAVVAVAVTSSLVLTHGGGDRKQIYGDQPTPVPSTVGNPPPRSVSADPLDSRTDFPATIDGSAGPQDNTVVFVRSTTGRTVGTLQPIDGHPLQEPVLSPDGTRIYGDWDNGSTLGYVDVATGRHTVLSHRLGEVGGETVSADGSTLAYEFEPADDTTQTHMSVVVRDLATGAEHTLPNAPGGPQILPMALSPDGSQLAVATTSGQPHTLLIVPTDAGFAEARTVSDTSCGAYVPSPDEPRWNSDGLWAVEECGTSEVPSTVTGVEIIKIDPRAATASAVHSFPVANIFMMAVLEGTDGPQFVTADESMPDSVHVYVRDPAEGWSGHIIPGLTGVDVGSAE